MEEISYDGVSPMAVVDVEDLEVVAELVRVMPEGLLEKKRRRK